MNLKEAILHDTSTKKQETKEDILIINTTQLTQAWTSCPPQSGLENFQHVWVMGIITNIRRMQFGITVGGGHTLNMFVGWLPMQSRKEPLSNVDYYVVLNVAVTYGNGDNGLTMFWIPQWNVILNAEYLLQIMECIVTC